MGSREAIFAAVGRSASPAAGPPQPAFDPLRFDDPAAEFAAQLEAAGGRCHLPGPDERLADTLAGLLEGAAAWSAVPELPSRRRVEADADPRQLADLEVAVLPGELAVAESGAVWVVPPDLLARAALFLAGRVVLCVPRRALVHELHGAYARIDDSSAPFACFVAGPSKTADIEQCLVIGAHGPRELDVVLHGEARP